MIIKRIVLAVLTASLALNPAGAVTMKEIFDEANTNVTPAGAYQGQSMSYYTGGGLFMRTPSKNYQIISMTPPSLKMNSCGMLDAYLGGLGHISAANFVAMLKQIGTGAVLGFGFKLALSAMSPEIKAVMTELNDMAQKINKANVDTCEAATGIVNAATDVALGKSDLNSEAVWRTVSGGFPDISSAWDGIQGASPASTQASIVTRASRSGSIVNGNITWQALDQIPDSFFSTDATKYKHLLMSLVGPYIITRKTSAEDAGLAAGEAGYDIKNLPALAYSIADLIGTPDGSGKIQLAIYQCDTSDLCANPYIDPTAVEFESIQAMVHERMVSIVDNMINGTKPSDTRDIAFINSTSIPIYKMLSVATQMRNAAIADYMILKYEEAIAAEYAANFLFVALKEIKGALDKASAESANTVRTAALEKLAARSTEIRKEYAAAMGGVYNKLSAVNQVATEVQNLERAMSASLPADLQDSLQFQISQQGGM
ncbi:MAG: hypothetical protein A3F73_09285 [Gallionellales bacterium RIFCSPLOWO2_12_FULL_59_22]|nr:MAG: hypothetical protein A3F73_09285 [Gallionellales bacterium RIFCSPLOWO2_12_FULL_59_22]